MLQCRYVLGYTIICFYQLLSLGFADTIVTDVLCESRPALASVSRNYRWARMLKLNVLLGCAIRLAKSFDEVGIEVVFWTRIQKVNISIPYLHEMKTAL